MKKQIRCSCGSHLFKLRTDAIEITMNIDDETLEVFGTELNESNMPRQDSTHAQCSVCKKFSDYVPMFWYDEEDAVCNDCGQVLTDPAGHNCINAK